MQHGTQVAGVGFDPLSALGLQGLGTGLTPRLAVVGGKQPDGTGLRGLAGRPQQAGLHGGAQLVVEHHQGRLRGCWLGGLGPFRAHGQQGVVGQDRADAGQNGLGAGAPKLAIGTRSGGRDPWAHAIEQGGSAIQRSANFAANPRAARLHARHKPQLDFMGLGGLRTDIHRYAGGAQFGKALACDQGVGVLQRSHHPAHARRNQGVTARAGAPLVSAGLQRDIDGGSLGVVAACGSVAQRHDLGMGPPGGLGLALPNDLARSVHQHGPNRRIGRTVPPLERGQRQRQGLGHGAASLPNHATSLSGLGRIRQTVYGVLDEKA